jgi:hypothetical protein
MPKVSPKRKKSIKSAYNFVGDFGEANLKRLEQSIAQSKAGLGVTLTLEQLRERFGLD